MTATYSLLERVHTPADLRRLPRAELRQLATDHYFLLRGDDAQRIIQLAHFYAAAGKNFFGINSIFTGRTDKNGHIIYGA